MAPSKFQIYVDQSMTQQAPTSAVAAANNNPLIQKPNVMAQEPPPNSHLQHYIPDSHLQGGDAILEKPSWPRVKMEASASIQRFPFDMNRIYPLNGQEFSFEEVRLATWEKNQRRIVEQRRCEEAEAERDALRPKLELATQQLIILTDMVKQQQRQLYEQQQATVQQQAPNQQQQSCLPPTQALTATASSNPSQSPPTNNRLSIVPQSLQPAQGNETDSSCYGVLGEATTVVQDWWKHTLQMDKFTVPIDQSQYIREHCATSTPNKDDRTKRPVTQQRRMSRPSMGGSPTMKLSPITETSRDCNSKSSSSSSAMSTTPGPTRKPLVLEPVEIHEPDKPLDADDPTTFCTLLRALTEPLESRAGYVRMNGSMPLIRNGTCFGSGADNYLVGKELSKETKMYTAQLLTDDSNSSNSDIPMKTICFRVDQPPNEWLFYICNELHRRIVRQKLRPDIELSVMNADPAIMYQNGSILIDEYFRYVPLEDYMLACEQTKKPFPKSVAAYITLELIQLVRGLHTCDIIHMNIDPKNIIITNCPSREEINCVDERTSIVKLIEFDRAIDARLLPADFRYNEKDSRPWRQDWLGILRCIHKMFFLEEMAPVMEADKWVVNKSFKGFPTDVWQSIFDHFLNAEEIDKSSAMVDQIVDALRTWIKANISFVVREATMLDSGLENYCKANNKSVRI